MDAANERHEMDRPERETGPMTDKRRAAPLPQTAAHPMPLSTRCILQTWWPLAASWVLMSVEQPAANAVIARLAEPTINLAAWGVVFSLSLVIEAPIIMLLAASTALSRDWKSYLWLRRFMMWAGAILTALHVLVAFTPLYSVVVGALIGGRPEIAPILTAARPGLMLMTPWTWSIAYRRFHQGVLIRFGHSRAVGIGTLVRLGSEIAVLALGYLTHSLPGTVVAGAAIACGVLAEALYTGLRVRPVLRDQVRNAPPTAQSLTLRPFLAFYVPLSLTSLFYLLVQPIGSAALSRMPNAVDSLAAWPVVSGLVFILRSLGVGYNEVVVALMDRPRAAAALRRFTAGLTAAVTLLTLAIAATPLAKLWFTYAMGLAPAMATLARQSFWLTVALPGLNVLQSWYQGSIVHSGRTRGVTEAVVIFLVSSTAVLAAGIVWGRTAGLYVGWIGFSGGFLLQTAWLWFRSRSALRGPAQRPADAQAARNRLKP